MKTPEMLEATHKRHQDTEVEEMLLSKNDRSALSRIQEKFDPGYPPFGGFPGVEKKA